MAYQLFTLPKATPVTAGSVVLPGSKLFFYETGTTTPQDTYSDSGLTTPNANPVVADANGLFGTIYLDPELQYKATLTNSADVLQYTVDPVNDQLLSQSVIGAYLYPRTDAEIAAGVTPTNYFYPPGNVLRYGADVSGATSSRTAFLNACSSGKYVYAPAGTYLITGNLNTVTSGTTIEGEGFSTILLLDSDNIRCFSLNEVTDITIRNLMIDGDKPSVGWETSNNFDFGVRIGETTATTQCERITIDSVYFKDIGLDGVYIGNARHVTVKDSFFWNCRRWGVAIVRDSADTFDLAHISVKNCFFDCTNGTGPSGKEYPLGAVDAEPDGEGVLIEYVEFDGIHSNAGTVALSGGGVRASMVSNIFIEHASSLAADPAELVLTNNVKIAGNVILKGQATLSIDGTDSVITSPFLGQILLIDPLHTNGTAKTAYNKGQNYWPTDWLDVFETNTSPGSSNTTKTRIAAEVDGYNILIDRLAYSSGSAGSYTAKHTLSDSFVAGDLVVVCLEIDRTDANTPTGNYLYVEFDDVTRTMQPPVGVSRVLLAQRLASTATTPQVNIGFSGTPGQAPTVAFRKVFVYVNPPVIDEGMFRIQGDKRAPDSFTGTLTGISGTDPTGTINVARNGDIVTLDIPLITGTSDTTAATITGMPDRLKPATAQTCVGITTDNGTTNFGKFIIGTDGVITLHVGQSATFTGSGTKSVGPCSITYRIR